MPGQQGTCHHSAQPLTSYTSDRTFPGLCAHPHPPPVIHAHSRTHAPGGRPRTARRGLGGAHKAWPPSAGLCTHTSHKHTHTHTRAGHTHKHKSHTHVYIGFITQASTSSHETHTACSTRNLPPFARCTTPTRTPTLSPCLCPSLPYSPSSGPPPPLHHHPFPPQPPRSPWGTSAL